MYTQYQPHTINWHLIPTVFTNPQHLTPNTSQCVSRWPISEGMFAGPGVLNKDLSITLKGSDKNKIYLKSNKWNHAPWGGNGPVKRLHTQLLVKSGSLWVLGLQESPYLRLTGTITTLWEGFWSKAPKFLEEVSWCPKPVGRSVMVSKPQCK